MSGSGKPEWHGFEFACFIHFASRGLNLDDVAELMNRKCRPLKRTKSELELRLQHVASSKVKGTENAYDPNMRVWDREKAKIMIAHILKDGKTAKNFNSAVELNEKERQYVNNKYPNAFPSVQPTPSRTATAGPFGMAAMSTSLSQTEGSMTATSGSNALQRYQPEDENEDEYEDEAEEEDEDEDEDGDEDDGFVRPQFDGQDRPVGNGWMRSELWKLATMVSYAKSFVHEIDPYFGRTHNGHRVGCWKWKKIRKEPEYKWADKIRDSVLELKKVRKKRLEKLKRQAKIDKSHADLEERRQDSLRNPYQQHHTSKGKTAQPRHNLSDAEGEPSKKQRTT